MPADVLENAVKTIVVAQLTEIPEVGALVSALVEILWPDSTNNVWDDIKDQVEALIDQKLADYEYQQVSEDLQGILNVITDYQQALQDSADDPTYISEKYNTALGAIESSQPHFQAKNYEVLLLPLLAQLANVHLALLRDGYQNGAKWGWTPQAVTDEHQKLQKQITAYSNWADTTVAAGLKMQLAEHVLDTANRWAIANQYMRHMQLAVLDNRFYWPFFDPDAMPTNGALPKLTREIYSDPQGKGNTSVDPAPTHKITALRVWGWDRIDAVQLAYGGSWGSRLGDQSGGTDQPPHGWNGNISDANPITAASGRSGDILNAMQFTFKDGTQTNLCGGNYPGGDPFNWSFDGHIVSSIKIMGVSDFYKSADCVIFGFRYEDSYPHA